jgi:homoserine dehydrogenase
MTHIAVLGHGVVGSGVVGLIHKNSDTVTRRTGRQIAVKRILDIREFAGLPYGDKFTTNFADIVNDPEISVVAEVMGGVSPAFEYAAACLKADKHVVTSNKELVAEKGAELLAIARDRNRSFRFEASVAGGTPVIAPLYRCLAANEIEEIAGILNGTTNYILTKMQHEGMSFAAALAQAQELGYAEADPTADVEGHDSCRKICILASLAFGSHIYPEDVPTQGITSITAEDILHAKDSGCVIKLVAEAKRGGSGEALVRVGPAMIPLTSRLAGVDDVYNGILVRGNAVGDIFFYGRGAGGEPTASAVVADILECLNNPGGGPFWKARGVDANTAPRKQC